MSKQTRETYITGDGKLDYILMRIADRLDRLEGIRPSLDDGFLYLNDKELEINNSPLTSDSIKGTENQVIVTIEDNDNVTLSTPQDIDEDATPIFAGFDQVGDSSDYLSVESDGTIKLNGGATVWNDLQFQISAGKQPTSSAPAWAALTTNTGEYGFDINEYIDLPSNELLHSWKEGTAGNFHLHIAIPSENSTGASQYGQFTVYVAYVDASGIWTETSLTAEQEIADGSSALENFYLDMGDVSFTGLTIGTQVKVRVERIAATGGTEYPSDIFIHQVGCHLEEDTMGSRSEGSK